MKMSLEVEETKDIEPIRIILCNDCHTPMNCILTLNRNSQKKYMPYFKINNPVLMKQKSGG